MFMRTLVTNNVIVSWTVTSMTIDSDVLRAVCGDGLVHYINGKLHQLLSHYTEHINITINTTPVTDSIRLPMINCLTYLLYTLACFQSTVGVVTESPTGAALHDNNEASAKVTSLPPNMAAYSLR